MQDSQEHIDTNQTRFALEEPLLDQPHSPRSAQLTSESPLVPLPWWKNKKVLLGGAIAILVVFILMIGLLLTSGGENPMLLPDPSPSPTTERSTEYQQRLKTLQDDLKKADPTQKELPFPPVSADITL